MTPEQAIAAWVHELRRVAPNADAALLHLIAERLAGDTPAALELLAADLVAIAGMVADEALCDVPASAHVVPMR